ncbi:MAG TPA: hypothetical protein VLW85_20460 [Myxococcales bacterium]|nr:hypothetical protein [Myxococcales bacterium]
MGMMSCIKPLGYLKFSSYQLKLGTQKAGKGAKEGWSNKYEKDRSKDNDPEVTPDPIAAMFFTPQVASNPNHLKTCNEIGNNFKDFHDAMLDAIEFAHNQWKLQAKIQDLQVMAVSAIGSPGCLKGPEMESLIKNAPSVASFTGNKQKHRDAVAKGVSKCFKDYQDNVMVPGLPWYPLFAAFPGPMAPPTPNIPVPLIACPSTKCTSVFMGDDMTKAMDDALDSDLKDKDPEKHYHALHDSIATVASLAFLIWNPSQMVMAVLGKGPVPSFAPPFVPVGPVAGGDNTGAANVIA